jgi:hypothetical protein
MWYVSTGVLQGPDEHACRSPHDLVHDAVCIFVSDQIFPGGNYLIFDFSSCLNIRIPLLAIGWMLGLCRINKRSLGRYLAYITHHHKWCIHGNARKNPDARTKNMRGWLK